jgi:tRNA pseudouridine13 synthase
LGDLSGNQFEIILREVDASPEALELACAALSESGFINYYGLQRFGMGGTVNHAVGSAVLKGEWKSVLEMVFKPKPGEKSEITKVKELFLAGDYRNALDNCPRFLPSERAILEHLNRSEYNRRDYSGAVNAVPRGTRLLWMHAYQSYVWNRAASHRIASFGLRVVIGDLVSLNAEGETNKRTDCATASHSNHGNMDGGLRGDDFQRIENLDNDLIHVVTADDIAQNKFSFTDVILPLPGYDVSLPRHATGEFYESLLHEDGLTLSHFRDQVPPQFRTRGTYRRVIQRAHNFTWKIISYLEPDDELATTEFSSGKLTLYDRAVCSHQITVSAYNVFAAAAAPSRKRPRDSDAVDLDSLSSAPITPSSPAAPPQGEGGSHASRRALALRFSLPPGAYATMLLRELTKQSMETEVHSAMSATSEPVSTKLDGAVE